MHVMLRIPNRELPSLQPFFIPELPENEELCSVQCFQDKGSSKWECNLSVDHAATCGRTNRMVRKFGLKKGLRTCKLIIEQAWYVVVIFKLAGRPIAA